jgi:hypothetical protein
LVGNTAEGIVALQSAITTVKDLAPADRDQMFALYETYYEAVDRNGFERDLAEKDAVVIIRSADEIVGFSTYLVRPQKMGAETFYYLFSGDTVLHSARWGDPVLLRGFFRAAGAAKARVEGRLFWFCIIGGHRTYRILPNFFREFFPSMDSTGSADLRTRCDAIAAARYGACFDPATGLIDFGPSQGHLRYQWADVVETATHNRHAAHFLKANPEYARGVELACLAELELGNLKRYAAISFAEGLKDGC